MAAVEAAGMGRLGAGLDSRAIRRAMIVCNWRDVLKHAWSLRLILLAGLLSGIELAMTIFIDNPPIPRGLFALLAVFVSIAAAVARFVAQRKVSG
jgi:hypothetical protein